MAKPNFLNAIKALKQKNMLVSLLMGFSSGLPYLLIYKTFQGWLTFEGVSNKTVGAIALLGIPYTCKFLWAPLMDRYSLGRLGRRRSWMLAIQIGLMFAIALLALSNPVQNLVVASFICFGIAFLGASQDVVVDAYRRESFKDEELGLGSALYTFGYRIALLITGGLAFILSARIGWDNTYLVMAAFMSVGIFTTFIASEPQVVESAPRTLAKAVIEPFLDFFKRKEAILILIFILLYKIGDSFSGNMLVPFYKELAFTQDEIGLIAKTLGMVSTILGAIVGGSLLYKLGILKGLYLFGFLQSLSTLSFAGLNYIGHNLYAFAGVVFFEDFSSGMGSAAFMAFMAALTNRSYTATQYALFTSFMAFTLRVLTAPSGFISDSLGWSNYFIVCALMAIPGLFLIKYFARYSNLNNLNANNNGAAT